MTTCTCSFLATVEGFHEEGCALQCRETLNEWPLGWGVAFARTRIARCSLAAGHLGIEHEGVVLSADFSVPSPVRVATRVRWETIGQVDW